MPNTTWMTPSFGTFFAEKMGEALGRGVARGLSSGLMTNQASRATPTATPWTSGPQKAAMHCKAKGCTNPARSKGLCSKHYQAARRAKLARA